MYERTNLAGLFSLLWPDVVDHVIGQIASVQY